MDIKKGKRALLPGYKKQIQKEIDHYCNEFITLIDTFLNSEIEKINFEAKIFYMKQKADFTRYMCENKTGNKLIYLKQIVNDLYKETIKELRIDKTLKEYDITKLGTYLNYSIFWFKQMGNKNKAYMIMYEPYKLALEHISGLP